MYVDVVVEVGWDGQELVKLICLADEAESEPACLTIWRRLCADYRMCFEADDVSTYSLIVMETAL